MQRQQDLRTAFEKFDDMLSLDCSLEEIADRLDWTMGQARGRYHVVCKQVGVTPDGEGARE